jgi:YVTN family beta-propeller protein
MQIAVPTTSPAHWQRPPQRVAVSGPHATLLVALLAAACAPGSPANMPSGAEPTRLPTGVVLDPVGTQVSLGSMPLAMTLAPGGRHAIVLLNGWREQGLQVVDRFAGRVTQTTVLPAVFLGLAFAPDSTTLYASGGYRDVVYRLRWEDGRLILTDSLALEPAGSRPGRRYPAGIALSPDGRSLYVAENLGDSLAVIALPEGRVVQRLATGRYPYGVAVAPDGAVYVSAWGAEHVSVFGPTGDALAPDGDIAAGRHPSALLLNADGSRLFVTSASTDRVAVVDTRTRAVIATLEDPPAGGAASGSTPNALALAPDGTRLLVAEADNNAVAVFALSSATAGVAGAAGSDRLEGRIPSAWYPTAVAVAGDSLLVVSGKGLGTSPNPDGRVPGRRLENPRAYTLGQTSGTLAIVDIPPADRRVLGTLSDRVARANGWHADPAPASYPPFEHVIYVIKENRTYDQVLGDLPVGDGDTSLVFFPRAVTPNHHALAERFGVFDRFFVNAEVSADGHNWSMAAYVTDYAEKTVPSNYASLGRSYDYEGTNRGQIPEDDVNEPTNGYLWDLAERAGVTLRNYGEFALPDREGRWVATKPLLAAHTDPDFPGWDLDIPDQRRADAWLAEFRESVRTGELPQLQILRLPNDHTSGASAGTPTPRAYVADNDLALGRVIEALSRSPFWKNTVVFVLEDDAQDGPDHVDSHRSPLLVISAYNRPGVIHRFANTTDVIATIADVLHLGSLSQFDHFGRPLAGIFAYEPDPTPYTALVPDIPLDERNPSGTRGALESERLDLTQEDRSDDELFNRILWEAVKGDAPYPGPRRLSLLELHRGR